MLQKLLEFDPRFESYDEVVSERDDLSNQNQFFMPLCRRMLFKSQAASKHELKLYMHDPVAAKAFRKENCTWAAVLIPFILSPFVLVEGVFSVFSTLGCSLVRIAILPNRLNR
jgi:hypothetical protein